MILNMNMVNSPTMQHQSYSQFSQVPNMPAQQYNPHHQTHHPHYRLHEVPALCVKHKSPIVSICVSLSCQRTKLTCHKCVIDHRDHAQSLISIEYILGKSEELDASKSSTKKNMNLLITPSKEPSTSSNSNTEVLNKKNKSRSSEQRDKDLSQLKKQVQQNSSFMVNTSNYNDDSTLKFPVQVDGNEQNNNNNLYLLKMSNQFRSSLMQDYSAYPVNTQIFHQQQQQQQQYNNHFTENNNNNNNSHHQMVSLNFPQFQSQIPSQNGLAIHGNSIEQTYQVNQPENQINFNEVKGTFHFEEIVSQDSNLERVCGFLSNLEHAKQSINKKIDSIREKVLQQFGIQASDLTYRSIGAALRSNPDQIEDNLENIFSKLRGCQNAMKANQLVYNTTYESKLEQIEEEIDRLMSASIVPNEKCPELTDASGQKIVPENELLELWEYYQISPSQEIDEVKKLVEPNCRYVIEFDGCAKGNPGRASAGFLIRLNDDENSILLQHNLLLGNKTINQAEYLALIYAMHVSHLLGIRHLTVLSDSEVIFKQMQKIHQVRSIQLKDYYKLANMMLSYFFSIHFTQISKRNNVRADALAASAL